RRLIAEVGNDRLKLAVLAALVAHRTGEYLGVAHGILARQFSDQADFGVGAEVPQQLATQRPVLEGVHVLAGDNVSQGTVALGAHEGQAAGHVVSQATGNGALDLGEVQVASTQFHACVRIEGRLGGGNVEGAGSGVLAVQGALRATQYLDALDVYEVQCGDGGTCEEHAVDVVTHTRIDTVIGQAEGGALAADADRGVARVGGVQLHRRNQFLDAVDVEAPGVGYQLAA